jgi:hypothetical protein
MDRGNRVGDVRTDSVIGRYVDEQGRSASVVERDRRLVVEHSGRSVHSSQIVAWDRSGAFEWSSAQKRQWFARTYNPRLASAWPQLAIAIAGLALTALGLLGPRELLRFGPAIAVAGAVWALYRRLTASSRIIAEEDAESLASEPGPDGASAETAERVTPVGRKWGNITLVIFAIAILLWAIGFANSPAVRRALFGTTATQTTPAPKP